ncbi:MAG TPA: hypothetical protein VGM10_05085 [Actinocrinis sp.]|jgi:hypothetical protein
MAEPDSGLSEDTARRLIAEGLAHHFDKSDFPTGSLASRGDVDAARLNGLLAAAKTLPPSAAPPGRTPLKEPEPTDREVAAMDATKRLVWAFKLADIDDTFRAQILAAVEIEELAKMALGIAVFAGASLAAQLSPVGWFEDVVLAGAAGVATYFLGTAVISAVKHLIKFGGGATATTVKGLKDAGHEFALACSEIGVNAVLYILTKKLGSTEGMPRAKGANTERVALGERNGQLVAVAADEVPAGRLEASAGKSGAGTDSPPAGKPPGGNEHGAGDGKHDGGGRGDGGDGGDGGEGGSGEEHGGRRPPREVTQTDMIEIIFNAPRTLIGKVHPPKPIQWPAIGNEGRDIMHPLVAELIQKVRPNPPRRYETKGPDLPGGEGGVDFEIKPASESGIATFVSKQWGKPGWTRHIRLFVYDAEANVYEVEFQTILEEEYNALGR